MATRVAAQPASAAAQPRGGSAAIFFQDPDFNFNFLNLLAYARYALTDELAKQIACPLLIADPEGEQCWPGQSKKLYAALPGHKPLVPFTRAEGADLHCEPKAPGLRAQRVFDWLDVTRG
jgi:hypothetical protein